MLRWPDYFVDPPSDTTSEDVNVQQRDIPSRALIRATIYIAPLGAWAYWPKAQASRRWLVRGIDRTAETWIVDLSPL